MHDLAHTDPAWPVGVVRVEDTSAALLALSAWHRAKLSGLKVVAVGGSNGKTTTVRLIDAAASGGLKGKASPKSFNNAVGLPLTLLTADERDAYLICEIGTNAPGEILPLATAAAPDMVVITSIGREHLEGLGSLEGVIAEESTLVRGLRPGGTALIPAGDGALRAAVERQLPPGARLLTFGTHPCADARITAWEQLPRGVRVCLDDGLTFTAPLMGEHNVSNACAAATVCRVLGVADAAIVDGLARAQPAPMRLEQSEHAGVTFINDAYNANPESVLAALRVLERTPAAHRRRVVILGDMLEQGAHAPAQHREVGVAAARLAPDLLVFVGAHSAAGYAAARENTEHRRVVHFPATDALAMRDIASLLRATDLVLLKGSRGVGLERVITAWDRAHAEQHEPKPFGTAALGTGG